MLCRQQHQLLVLLLTAGDSMMVVFHDTVVSARWCRTPIALGSFFDGNIFTTSTITAGGDWLCSWCCCLQSTLPRTYLLCKQQHWLRTYHRWQTAHHHYTPPQLSDGGSVKNVALKSTAEGNNGSPAVVISVTMC